MASSEEDEEEGQNTCSKRVAKSICAPDFLKRIINPLPIVYPMSLRKLGWWGVSTSALAACITLEVKYQAFSIAANYSNFILMGFIYGIDPVISTLCLCTAKYEPANPEPSESIPILAEEIIETNTAEPSQSTETRLALLDMEWVDQSIAIEDLVPVTSLDEPQQEMVEIIIGETNNASTVVHSADPQEFLPQISLIPQTDTSEVAIIIACHNSASRIGATVISCLRHVRPDQIYVVDNGNSDLPADDTYQVVKKIHPNIIYIWGHIGSKTMSQYIGALFALMQGRKFILTLDDDMRLDKNFLFGIEKINQKCRALFYAIRAVHPEGLTNLLINWQDLEYKLSDLSKLSQARFGGALYPHGAGSLWDAKVFLLALWLHDAVFFAEDVKLGMILTRLGYSMGAVSGTTLATEAPASLFGAAPNFFDQRVCSWEMGRQAYFWWFVRQLVTVKPPSNSIIDCSMFKLAEFYAVYCNVVDWWKLPLCLLLVRSELYWIKLAGFYAASMVPALLWNYIKLPLNNRNDLQVSMATIITFPLFKFLESGMSVLGLFYLLANYLPNYKAKLTVPEHVALITEDRTKLEQDIEMEQSNWTKLLDSKINASISSNEMEMEMEVEQQREPLISYRTILHHRFFGTKARDPEVIPAQQDQDIEMEWNSNYDYIG